MTTRNAMRRFPLARKDTALLDAPTLAHLSVQFKADKVDNKERTFEGLASVWGLDLGDDVMHKGAFKETIDEWRKSGDAMPLLNSHNHFDVTSAVGQMLDAKETKDGLWTKWEVIDGADGDAVLARLRPSARTGRAPVSKMSIGYEPAKFDMEENDQARFGMVRNLRKVNLKEVSLVIFPMAPGARIDTSTVKSIDLASVKSFVASASATEPQSIDDITKLELRRLASRIGVLLAPQKSATLAPTVMADVPADPPASVDPAEPVETPETPAPTPSDPPADAPADPVQAGAPEVKGEAKTEDPQQPAHLDPLMQEALEQRLRRTLTQSTTLG